MSRLDDDLRRWLDEAGLDDVPEGDDPWAATILPVANLTPEQIGFLSVSVTALVTDDDIELARRSRPDGTATRSDPVSDARR